MERTIKKRLSQWKTDFSVFDCPGRRKISHIMVLFCGGSFVSRKTECKFFQKDRIQIFPEKQNADRFTDRSAVNAAADRNWRKNMVAFYDNV
ncbi:MAG: hypothetical protein LUG93_04890 [Lachnospiraceae bacterium]|nr:hypothetical protein [Lachnospiraceae bacterium]